MARRKFFFAWIDESEVFDPAVHNREDERVYSFKLSQQEGDFAALSVDVRNPRVGLLSTGRKQWVFLSYQNANGDISLQFKGRLVALPNNIFDTVVTFEFTARPSNFLTQKAALAAGMRTLPWWDQVLISPDSWDDDDVVLEARSALWHIDRATHVVSYSDILVPEDGTIEYSSTEAYYDNVSVTMEQTPVRQCSVTATFPWDNSGAGTLSLGPLIIQHWPKTDASKALINSFTFSGLVSSWPQPGASIGTGWNVINGELEDLSLLSVVPLAIDLDLFTTDALPHPFAEGSILFPPSYSGTSYGGVDGSNFTEQIDVVIAPMGWGKPTLDVAYAATRGYAQTLQFTMEADMQAIITDPDGADVIAVSLNANKLTDVGYNGEIACSTSARTYLDTARGQQSVEYCLLLARANLINRARAVTISFDGLFDKSLDITLRHGALLEDPRLPGEQALGKVKAYEFSMDGDSGTVNANITIGCAVGFGGSYTSSGGTGVYAADGYMETGYQQISGAIQLVGTSDVTFEMPDTETFDDLDISSLSAVKAVTNLTISNGPASQASVIQGSAGAIPDAQAVNTALQAIPTTISLSLVPIATGPFTGGVAPAISKLIIPQQINLEAGSES